MPRIEKVRITGVRYDKMKKHYENAIFDFINEEEPQHALLTLVNGGGKGMLLQMLFQTLMPLTTWGKNGENHIDALFYNEKQQFEPYTFHVALEWRLDTDPAEWLLTGICVTARKYGQDKDETETEPQYFLYTSKYRKPEDWTIDTLPLFDQKKNEAIIYEELEAWLKKHKQQFQLFSKSKQTAYYQYLSSYGIERSEWRHMKEINRDEGGIEHYFKKGLDNFGLFHHLIIPEISNYLEDDNEENLVKIFRDNSIIAQKLPKLLKREDGYRMIHEKLLPLKATLEEGQQLETTIQEHHERANFYYFGMEEIRKGQQHEQEKWEVDKKQTAISLANYHWQEDNLEYAKDCRTADKMSKQIAELDARLTELNGQKELLEAEKHEIEVDIALTDYLEASSKLKTIETQISHLEESLNLSEEKDKITEIEHQIVEGWKEIEIELVEDVEAFQSLKSGLQKRLAALKSQISLDEQDKIDIKSKLGTCTTFIKSHNEKAIKKEQQYGKDINRDPELVQKRFLKEQEELVSQLHSLENKQDELEAQRVQISGDIGETKASIKSKQLELSNLDGKKKQRLQAEREFHQKWCRYHQEDTEFRAYGTDDLLDLYEVIDNDLTYLRSNLGNVQKELWHHQLDTALVHPDYWIPNNDVKKLVEKLSEQGIKASYGTELLLQFSKEEQEDLIGKFPLLAYGIVIHQHDWEKRVDQLELQQMLLHSPVPIFIRERMNQPFPYPYELVSEQGIHMTLEKEEWHRWKNNLSLLTEGFITDIDKLEARITETTEIQESLKALQVETYQEILDEERAVKESLADLEGKRDQLAKEMASIDDKLNILRKDLKENNEKQTSLQKLLHELEGWILEHKQALDYHKQKKELQTKLAQIEARLKETNREYEEENGSLSSWSQAYFEWKNRCEYKIEELRKITPDIQFPYSEKILLNEHKTPKLRKDIFIEIDPIVTRWQQLQQKIHSATSELASARTKRDFYLEDQQKKQALLANLETFWEDRSEPEVPRDILIERRVYKEKEINISNAEASTVKGEVQDLSGRLKQLVISSQKQEKQILNKHHLAADSWQGVNLEEKQEEIERMLIKLKDDLREQDKILKDLIEKQQQLLKQQDILRSHLVVVRQVGEVPTQHKEQIKAGPDKLVQQWIGQNNEYKKGKEEYQKSFKERLKDLSLVMQDDNIDAPLRKSMNQLIPQLESDSIRSGLSVITSVIEHIQLELLKLKEDKQTAEKAQEVWVDRAVYRVIRIIQSLKRMVNKMKIKNKEGHSFPLVEIDRLDEILRTDEEDYRRLLREHFAQTIEKLLETEEAIENLSDQHLKKYINDSQLVLISLRNRYPTLHIYKPQTTNAFLYEKPRKHHYTTWETLNKGSRVEAKGSGGQLLAARTVIMMMIMTFKRQEQSTNWSVLITDNPFGQAVSAHILDPIFSIADILRFQWIVLAPPELIKLDVSRRFPVYWKLELNQQKRGEVIKEVLQHGGRTFDEAEWSLF